MKIEEFGKENEKIIVMLHGANFVHSKEKDFMAYIMEENLKQLRSLKKKWLCNIVRCYFPNSQKAIALAAATFSESTPCDIGIFTV